MILVVLILLLTLAGFFSEKVPTVASAVFALVSLAGLGLLDVKSTLSGFSNSAVLTIAAMFVMSQGLVNTGALEPVTVRMARWSKGQTWRLILVLGATVPIASAFVNNTPIVIMMVPVLMAICRQFHVVPSKLFIPLSYFAILGGTSTLMGTSTNLLIDGLWRDRGGPGFQVFEFSQLGVIFLVVGIIYMITLGRHLLPTRESLSSMLPVETRTNYVSEVVLLENSRLVGDLVDKRFPQLGGIRFLELVRDEEIFLGDDARALRMQTGDALILEGEPDVIAEFLQREQLEPATVIEDDVRVPVVNTEYAVFELVIVPDSSFVGRRVSDLGLNRHYGVKVMAIQRNGRHHRMDLRRMRLKVGDTLLVQASLQSVESIKRDGEVLVVDEYKLSGKAVHAKRATLILVTVVVLAVMGVAPLVVLALAGAALMTVVGCLRTEEALRSIDVNVMFIMIGTIPLGQALVETGLIGAVVDGMVTLLGNYPPVFMLAALYLLSNLLTAVLSNATVAVLMTPFAFALSDTMGVAPQPFLMGVAFGSCTCFASPIGYQSNLIVMGPGGYSLRDYIKVGVPLSFVLWIVATIAIPMIWPFT